MKCSAATKLLSSYLDGELQAKDSERLDAHLKQCRHCADKLESLQAMSNMFAQVQRYESPAGFSARVLARLDEEPTSFFTLWPIFTRFAETVAILVAITAGIMSGGALISSISSHQKGTVVSALSLDSFEALPPQSLGRAYLVMTEERQ